MNKYIATFSTGKVSSFPHKDAKDCTVRALSNSADIPYEVAQKQLFVAGRKFRKGCSVAVYGKVYEENGFKVVGVYGKTQSAQSFASFYGVAPQKGATLENVLPSLNSGKYIVIIRGHAFSVVDGKVIDTFAANKNKRVVCIYKKD